MSACDSCPSKGSCSSHDSSSCTTLSIKVMPKYGNIKNAIGVISGKGGVGKSTITGVIATMLRKKVIRLEFLMPILLGHLCQDSSELIRKELR